MRDKGEWEYLALESGLLELFLIRVFVRMRCSNLMACPLAHFEGEGDIGWEVDGLDGDGKVSNWQFFRHSGLPWARLNGDFREGGGEIEGNEDRGVERH